MEKYNYERAIIEDIVNWLKLNEFDPFIFNERIDAAVSIFDELHDDNDITGNGDGYDSKEKCEEYLCHNWGLAIEACREYCINPDTLIQQIGEDDIAQYIDCTIRCYLLSDVILKALKEYEDYLRENKNENLSRGTM